MIMLSILICAIPERKKAFNELCFKIGDQLESEAHTDAILHQYNHSSKTSEADKIIKAGYV